MSSLEALESCFAVGPIIEKASHFFKAHRSFLKRQEVGLLAEALLPWSVRILTAQSLILKTSLSSAPVS